MNSFYTEADLDRYRGQKRAILRVLAVSTGMFMYGWVGVEFLEEETGSRRVASRIDELRADWLIETKKNPSTKRAMYRLTGKRTEARQKKAHCETCTCSVPPQPCRVQVSYDDNGPIYCGKPMGHSGQPHQYAADQLAPEQARLL